MNSGVEGIPAVHGQEEVKSNWRSRWGAWMAHLGLLAWVTGVLVGQLLMIGAVASTQIRRRRAGLPPDYTPLGPSLAGGAVLAVALAGLQI